MLHFSQFNSIFREEILLRMHKFHIVGLNVTIKAPCILPCGKLSNSTKNAIRVNYFMRLYLFLEKVLVEMAWVLRDNYPSKSSYYRTRDHK